MRFDEYCIYKDAWRLASNVGESDGSPRRCPHTPAKAQLSVKSHTPAQPQTPALDSTGGGDNDAGIYLGGDHTTEDDLTPRKAKPSFKTCGRVDPTKNTQAA